MIVGLIKDVGWDWESVLPYFKKSETHEEGADDIHGGEGPLYVSRIKHPNAISISAIEACKELGYPLTDDFNKEIWGAGLNHLSVGKDHKRCSTAKAFLDPVKSRPNLHIHTNALAQRLIFEGDECIGVQYLKDGELIEMEAEKEVIVSCGTIESAKLLMLSGIGDKQELESVGIPVVKDLKGVGKNLQDHLLTSVIFKAKKKFQLRKPICWKLNYSGRAKKKWLSLTYSLCSWDFLTTARDSQGPKTLLHFVQDLSDLPVKDILN